MSPQLGRGHGRATGVRPGLPSGTVTFLFTDVEGSTRLLQQLGAEEYAEAVDQHRRLLRSAFSAHGGVEVDTQGDAFFVAFPTVAGALAAAATVQEALAGGPIRVRIGVHTGSPLLTAEGYVGEDVHRAARIAAAGHGGQVLVSSATAALATAASLLDLGEHRFKDLGSPERVFQLGVERFSPIKSLYRTNLPVPATPFIGREDELAAVFSLVGGGARLVSLTGPGGTGKTRLALQAAAEVSEAYPGGVYWVPLAPIRDPSLVLSTVASAVGVAEEAGRSPLESLNAAIGTPLLLLLDNAEHLMPRVAVEVAALLAAVPTLNLLVTSRERLRVSGEQTYPVPTLAATEGRRLFMARAQATDAAFAYTPAVDELCARLDHLPLALELAAARVGLLSTEQLVARLGQRLDLLQGARDADPRQQTLRTTVAWSYELLGAGEREAFCRFSVFADGCTLAAAEEICGVGIDTLQSLLDKSLLRRRETPREPRLWMLETIRQFAAEELERAGGAAEAARRQVEYYGAMAQKTRARAEAGAAYDIDSVESELGNLRVAFEGALALEPARALALAGDLGEYWATRAHLREGRERVAAALAAAPEGPAEARIRALRTVGVLALAQGDLDAARSRFAEALRLACEHDRGQLGFIFNGLGIEAWYRGALDEAARLLHDAVEAHRASGNLRGENAALMNLAGTANALGDHRRAVEILSGAADTLRRLDDRRGLANVLNNLGVAQEAAGLRDEARGSLSESVELCRLHELNDTLRYALASLGHLLLDSDPSAASDLYRESLDLMQVTHDLRGIAYCLEGLARAALGFARPNDAAWLLGAAAAIRSTTGASLDRAEQAEVDETRVQACAMVGEEPFDAQWRAGNQVSAEQAIERALATRAS